VLTPDEFRELSALAALLIPREEATLTLWPSGSLDRSLFLSTQGTDPKVEESGPPGEVDFTRLMTEDESRVRGFGSGARVPLRITDEVGGVLILLARSQGAYGDDAIPKAKTLADYLSAVLSRDHSVSQMFEYLINTLADVLDPREVFQRVSENVGAVLPHDRLGLAFEDGQGRLIFQAATSDEAIPLEHIRLKVSDLDQAVRAGFKLIGDLATEYLPVVEPVDFQKQMLAAGYRSVLAAHTSSRISSATLGTVIQVRYSLDFRVCRLTRRAPSYSCAARTAPGCCNLEVDFAAVNSFDHARATESTGRYQEKNRCVKFPLLGYSGFLSTSTDKSLCEKRMKPGLWIVANPELIVTPQGTHDQSCLSRGPFCRISVGTRL
jgi:hypothetical protein